MNRLKHFTDIASSVGFDKMPDVEGTTRTWGWRPLGSGGVAAWMRCGRRMRPGSRWACRRNGRGGGVSCGRCGT
jgi:hypothetical protein